MRKILVTSALPYANGPIHLGHMLEMVQTDIWVRFQKLMGHECLYVCADDAHGTPIMVYAEKQGITPEALIEKIHQEHKKDLADFSIEFDSYYTTHSPENKQLAEEIYSRLEKKGHLSVKTIEQFYDPVKNMFLPDRYVKGECPVCGTAEQYGDSCEACGATYASHLLKNPVSALSGVKPVFKTTEHVFFNLSRFEGFLKEWINQGHLQEEIVNKLQEWFKEGLQDWDITRDSPYFGFQIPGRPHQYFYVWLDAPIGYMASFKKLGLDFEEFWQEGSKTELYHFIGKDIVYFHALFWPAVLKGAGFRTPTNIYVHGFVTVNGQKMSKSKGTFIRARDYLDRLKPDYLRYYFAGKLTSKVTEVDFNIEDFCQRVNSDLVGKVVNIASRTAGFLHKHFEGKLSATLLQPQLFEEFVTAGDEIRDAYNSREYSKAIRKIMQLADQTNQWIDHEKPWQLVKDSSQLQRVQDVCSLGIELFRLISFYLKPVLPTFVADAEAFLNSTVKHWDDRKKPLLGHTIQPFKPLLQRIDQKEVEVLLAVKNSPA